MSSWSAYRGPVERGFVERIPCPDTEQLAPTEGTPTVAQAVLHREILHVHAFLDHTLTLLRTHLAILSPPFMDRITSPHLQVQLRGLDSAIRQATQATHTALHYNHELMTTFGMIHTWNFDSNQLGAELRGITFFRDHRIPPPRPPPRPPSSSTATTSTPDYDFFNDSQSRTTTSRRHGCYYHRTMPQRWPQRHLGPLSLSFMPESEGSIVSPISLICRHFKITLPFFHTALICVATSINLCFLTLDPTLIPLALA